MSDSHVDLESLRSVARKTDAIAEGRPDAVSRAANGVAEAMPGNEGSPTAEMLRVRFDNWVENYELLSKQVTGFAEDLNNAISTWDEIENTSTDLFTRYGKDL
ncbi:hypothetical protein [Haloechinothrix halophila]|uniref:hypothetical protein n=1 Tax=Haloechinothrix halophila TaxID=1069073 RepID=UPI00040AB63F|nr:hypothetical protein [Haloechinothrix halophila]